VKPPVTRHILKTSNGLGLEAFFNEEAGELCIRSLCASVPSREEMKRAMLEIEQWRDDITRDWLQRTGANGYKVISGCDTGKVTCAFHSKR
jgi:hypothetical protein